VHFHYTWEKEKKDAGGGKIHQHLENDVFWFLSQQHPNECRATLRPTWRKIKRGKTF